MSYPREEGRGQRAEGRGHRAAGRGQKVEGRRERAEGSREPYTSSQGFNKDTLIDIAVAIKVRTDLTAETTNY
jgi:hypothetical protein